MKKLLSMILIVISIFGLVACSNDKESKVDQETETSGKAQDNQETNLDENKTAKKIDEITIVNSWSYDEGFSTIVSPELNSNLGIAYLANNFYETLVNIKDGDIVPGLAESWEISEDGKIYIFNLKQGVKFTDGEDFNAEAVKTHLDNVPGLLGAFNGSYGLTSALITEVKVKDEYTVEVHLASAYYGALQDFSILTPMGIMSPNAFTEDGKLSENIRNTTLGTGPYKFEKVEGKGKYTFVKNLDYKGEDSDVNTFHIKVIPDNETKNLALRSGEIDIIIGNDKISYDLFEELSNDNKFEAKKSDNVMKTRYLGLNTTKKPFNNKNVRLALNYAIDKNSISENIFSGIEQQAEVLLNKNLPYSNVKLDKYEYDVEKAKKLLEDEGWIDTDGDGIREKNGEKLKAELPYMTTGKAISDDLMLAIASDAKNVGIEVELVPLEMMAWFGKVQQGDYNISASETYGLPYDPMTIVNNFRTKPMVDYVLIQGLSHLEDQNSFINSITTLTDEEAIKTKFGDLLREIHENAALIPITDMKELVVYNSEKIIDYEFLEAVGFTNISGIKTK